MDTRTYLNYWAELYKTDMLTNIMPFWLRYGVDKEHGGIYTCVARNGELMDSTKSVWFQGRFAFTCCYAYNNIEARPEWLEAAKSTLTSSRNTVSTATDACISKSLPTVPRYA